MAERCYAFDEVKGILDDALENHSVPMSDIAITYQGKTVYRYMNGTRDEERRVPLSGDELYFCYSATKLVTVTAALQLYERGLLKLEDEVGRYLPEYYDVRVRKDDQLVPPDTPLQLFHLFTMTSGFGYDLDIPEIKQLFSADQPTTTREVVRAMAKQPLSFEPGTHFRYGISHDILAAVIEVVSGMRFGEYLQKNIFDVCGMKNTYIGVPTEHIERLCAQYKYNAELERAELISKRNEFLASGFESGGAGLVSCVADYLLFVRELAYGGRLLKPETLDLMRGDHLPPSAYEDFQRVKLDYSYGLGVRTNIGDTFSAKGEFGWDGAAGAYVLVDPDNQLGVFYATHIRRHGDFLYDTMHRALRDAIYRALGIRS